MNDQLSQALINELPFQLRIAWLGKAFFSPDYSIPYRGFVERDDIVAFYGAEGSPKIGLVSGIMKQSTGYFVKKIQPKENTDQHPGAEEPVAALMLICRFMLCEED